MMLLHSPQAWHTYHIILNYVSAIGLSIWAGWALHLSTRPPIWVRRQYGRKRFHAVSAAVQGLACAECLRSDAPQEKTSERPNEANGWRARDAYVTGVNVIPPVTEEPQLHYASDVTGVFGTYKEVQREAEIIRTPTAGWDIREIWAEREPEARNDIVYAEVVSPPQGAPAIRMRPTPAGDIEEHERDSGWETVEAEIVEDDIAEQARPEQQWRKSPLSTWMPIMPEDEEDASLATLTFDDFLREGRITPLGALGSLVSADMDSYDYKHNQETLRLGIAELGLEWDIPADLELASA